MLCGLVVLIRNAGRHWKRHNQATSESAPLTSSSSHMLKLVGSGFSLLSFSVGINGKLGRRSVLVQPSVPTVVPATLGQSDNGVSAMPFSRLSVHGSTPEIGSAYTSLFTTPGTPTTDDGVLVISGTSPTGVVCDYVFLYLFVCLYSCGRLCFFVYTIMLLYQCLYRPSDQAATTDRGEGV